MSSAVRQLTGVIALFTALLPARALAAQGAAGATPGSPAGDPSTVATAVRTAVPPRLDGRDDDPAWRTSLPVGEFRMFALRTDTAPTFRTEARVLYDDHALYILVRAFDPHPDSIVRLLARRDTDGPPNDQVLLFIDSYHDRRSGYNFIVNAAGVKSDYLLFDDVGSDQSWDGVWDVATGVDSLGWVAEFAIPFHQLRFPDGRAPTFGLLIGRWVGRNDERASWPQYRRSRAGLVSQLGTLTGLSDLAHPASVQATPYALLQGRTVQAGGRRHQETRPAMGGDLTWVPRSNVGVRVTLNPDFGQVEADPAVLNLNGTEVFQSERRAFFLEDRGLFAFPIDDDGSALFYSRRIGRRPLFLAAYGGDGSPTETTILGAARVTVRPAPSWTLAGLSALTQEEAGADRPGGGPRYVIEPRTHYGVMRLQRDFRGGRSGVGLMLTRADRDVRDSLVGRSAPQTAQAVAITAQHQTRDGAYQANAWAARSDVRGRPAAIAGLQLSPAHAFQRPDDGAAFDSTRAGLTGTAVSVGVGKVGGGITRFSATYQRITTGFDVNDLGYLDEAGVQSAWLEAGLRFTQPGRLLGVRYRRVDASVGFAGDWSTTGLPHSRSLTVKTSLELPSQAWIRTTLVGGLAGAYCEFTCSRGGPAVVNPPRTTVILDVTGTPRARVLPHVALGWDRDDEDQSRGLDAQLDLTWRARSNLTLSLGAYALDAHYAWHYYARFGDALSDTVHYTVAQLDLVTRSLTARANYTIAPTLSLQWYAQAYVSRGAFADVREIAEPRSRDWSRRFRPYADSAVAASPGGIDFKQFRSNLVLRWEYRAGSTLFVVWSQGRDVSGTAPATPGLWPGRDLRELFSRRPDNTLAVKLSYWWSP